MNHPFTAGQLLGERLVRCVSVCAARYEDTPAVTTRTPTASCKDVAEAGFFTVVREHEKKDSLSLAGVTFTILHVIQRRMNSAYLVARKSRYPKGLPHATAVKNRRDMRTVLRASSQCLPPPQKIVVTFEVVRCTTYQLSH